MAKILLVDDDSELSQSIAGWLTHEQHTVEAVLTGRDGWEKVSSNEYDLLILDWDIPDLNGIEILKRYRSTGGVTSVLMLTGHTSIDDRALGLDSGADDYLTKPFHVTELSARVRALLRRQSSKQFHQPLGRNNEEVLARADLAGSLLASRYEFLEVVGQGGAGIVFKARHPIMEKLVAVKMLLTDQADREGNERFQIEAKAASRLDHGNIVAVHDFGVTERGQQYMVMEYIDGKNLSDMIDNLGPPPLATGLDICLQICDGLSHAHEMRILHRDMKTANIMLKKYPDRPPVAKILDFGLAKLQGPDPGKPAASSIGRIFGSPPYMSPEQVRGEAVDQRSDIYSLGCVVYEVLSGFPPHMGENAQQIMTRHIEEDVSPMRELRPDLNLPEELDEAVLKALARKPEGRFQTVREFKAGLERARRS